MLRFYYNDDFVAFTYIKAHDHLDNRHFLSRSAMVQSKIKDFTMDTNFKKNVNAQSAVMGFSVINRITTYQFDIQKLDSRVRSALR